MLNFFRKHQKIFFIFVTATTIASFVFFGTYQAFAPGRSLPDEVAFQTLDGKKVKRSYLNQLCYFLSFEPTAPSRRGMLGNFINDGVLSNDFFEGGLALPLFQAYQKEIGEELETKLGREKGYSPYVHPSVKFLSATSVWGLFAPGINQNLKKLQLCESASTEQAFQARVSLYLAERHFPASFLAQVLHYQEKDNPAIPSDPRLLKEEVALFGYRSAQDWFGSRFIECAAQFILNSAAYAKKHGYVVTSDEARMDLLVRAEKTYEALKDIPSFPAKNGQELFQFYLKTSQIEEGTLVRMWQDVLLFRRLFQDGAGAALLDTHTLKSFFSKAKEYVSVELYQMPSEFRLQTGDDLKLFEKYLAAVSPEWDSLLDLPSQFDSIENIRLKAPELVGRRYSLEVGSISKKSLQAKVTVKETWNWELSSANWEILKGQFPLLASQLCADEKARELCLEKVDKKTRFQIDEFARAQIVNAHPEWIEEALGQAVLQEKDLFLNHSSKKGVLEGISNSAALMERLEHEDSLLSYSQDQETFYRIIVKKRAESEEVVPFKEVKKEGLLKGEDKDCLPLAKALYKDALEQGIAEKGISDDKLLDFIAPYRFASFLRKNGEGNGLWMTVKKEETLTRSAASFIPFEKACTLQPEECSKLIVDSKEGAYWYKLLDKKVDTTLPMEKVIKAQGMLFSEAKAHYMEEILKEIRAKNSIVFSKKEET